MLKAIHAAEDVHAAREKARQVVAKLRDQRLMKAAELIETSVHETLTYYSFPEEHCAFARTIRWSGSCARSGDARVSLGRSPMASQL